MSEQPPIALAVSASSGPYDCVLRSGADVEHGEVGPDLAPTVARLFEHAGRRPEELAELRLDIGPGSYTGLRVAVTFARTLQAFAGTTVRIATSLELLALRAFTDLAADPTHPVRPILDARRGRFHHASVSLTDRVAALDPPRAATAEELLAAIAAHETLLAEPAALPILEPIAHERGCPLLPLTPDRRTNLASLLFHPALTPRPAPPATLQPLYLMASYAD